MFSTTELCREALNKRNDLELRLMLMNHDPALKDHNDISSILDKAMCVNLSVELMKRTPDEVELRGLAQFVAENASTLIEAIDRVAA